MQKISNSELMNITGGGLGLGFILGAVIVVISGIVDGFLRPIGCRK